MGSAEAQIVQEFCNRYPKTPNLTLAKWIYREHPNLFRDPEAVRVKIRYYRGANGEGHRKYRKLDKPLTPKRMFAIPEGDYDEYVPYIIKPEYDSGIILSDIHTPFQDPAALEIALEYTYKRKPAFILFNGDSLDFHRLSFFERDPRKRNALEEIEMFREFILEPIIKNFPDTKIIFKIANHEERFDRHVLDKVPELYHFDNFRLKGTLKFDELGIDYIDRKRVIQYHQLNIIHGHEYKFSISNPVNPARGIFLRTHKSTLAGHFHQVSEHTETSINGELITCWSTGCLCGLSPEWLPLNKWSHGFAEITREDETYWRVKNHKIIERRKIV